MLWLVAFFDLMRRSHLLGADMRIHLPQSLLLVSALMALSHASMASADEVAEFQNAQTAAHAWLLDVDQGDYPKSWQEAAEPLKKQ